ncbi:class I SAM-dependent methyltransferase [Terrabacter sp. C0L_2]|uniref:class I SAM-dependent methyltransferase n=1 Tax=Terrabacter sp. C0L_2 TaxID=3108389 RepID=UPI002ED69198|nr:class I SAM-dependent methyltransferase [Terrabacter sp. C0L_2]
MPVQPLALQVLDVARAAGDLVVRSDVMAVLVIAGSAAAWLLAGWVRVRAAAPGVSHRRCLLAGADLVACLPRSAPTRAWAWTDPAAVGRGGLAPPELAAAASGVTLALLVPASVLAAGYLVLTGHLPARASAGLVAATTLVVLAGLCVATRRVARVPGRNRWLAVRGPHLTAAAVLGEVVVAMTTTAAAWALTHTEGVAVSLLEVGLAGVVARVVTLASVPAAGVGLADVVFAATLAGVGLSAGASIATVAVWRLGLALAWLAALAGRRPRARSGLSSGVSLGGGSRAGLGGHSEGPLSLPSEPTGSAAGEWLHRAAFKVIGTLPAAVARRLRMGVFQALFSLSEDPWRYDGLPYERRKRQMLVASLPPARAGSGIIVELGCADGHNLQAIAEAYPSSRVVGLDISPVAVAAARRRTGGQPQVRVEQSDARTAALVLNGVGVDSIDVLIVAEMLYYLGGPARVNAELAGLAPMLRPSGVLVLVHGAGDAERLHPAAVVALGCASVERVVVEDVDRPFVVEEAHARQLPV